MAAVVNQNWKMVKLLMEKQANLFAADNVSGYAIIGKRFRPTV